MPRARWCPPEIYELYDRWRRECLIGDGSLFTADEIWADSNLATLQTTLGSELVGSGTFFQKLRAQLVDHPAQVRQLGVEFAYLEYLGEGDTKADTKRKNLGELADLLPAGVGFPAELAELHGDGIASYGPGKSYRDFYLRFLLKFARRAKEAAPEQLNDPWQFRDLVSAVRTSTDGLQANAVLHACFPDEFDVMISGGHRSQLLNVFGDVDIVAAAQDQEHRLLAVRELLQTRLPIPIDEPYDDAVRAIWGSSASPEWDELVERAAAVLPVPTGQREPEFPPSDPDLLEALREWTGTTHDWQRLLTEAAARLVARGKSVRQWHPLT